jgi:glycosyltransferase involved in cell wall biosynthesis
MNITVIVAVHNGEQYVGRAIRSLLAQSLPRDNFEILVVDDGSSDRTPQILESFAGHIRTLRCDENRGLPAALNLGIRNTHSRYIVRVDADDYVHGDFLLVEHLFMSLNPHVDAVACDYYLVDDNEHIIEQRNVTEHPIACGLMFKTDSLVALGLYDEQMLFHEDTDLRIRFTKEHSITRIELPLYRYRRHDGNMTNDQDEMERYASRVRSKHDESARQQSAP